ncbi:MAG: hypothetical protein GVY26_12645 [Bacteroidetes bacterium]|jgi:hypothetical protein|nr:hypothetical protein [Bacteroidota bacterium]
MRRLLFTYLTITVLLAVGCVKEVDTFQPIEMTSGNIDRFFEAVQSNPIQASWDASQAQTIQLPGNSRVIVPANALVTAEGAPVSGQVHAKVLPLYTKEALLRNRVPTIADGRIVNSAGALHIRIEQAGQRLYLSDGQSIVVQLTTALYNSEMRLFTGEENESGFVEWSLLNLEETPINSRNIYDDETGETEPGFEFVTNRLGYLNVGILTLADKGEGEVCVNLPHGFNPQNTVAFVVMKNYNGLTAVPETDGPNLPHLCRMGLPALELAEVVVIAEEEEGQYFFARETITITENLTIKIQPARAELSEIMLALEGL